MNRRRQANVVNIAIHHVLCGAMTLSLVLFGMIGQTLASDPPGRLAIHSGLLTGRFIQVPLGSVLAQLKNQLHITYVAPEAELEKRISVTLNNEPLSDALSKILAPWDYAFTLDTAGKINVLYVMAKVSSAVPVTADLNASGKTDRPKEAVHDQQETGRKENEHPVRLRDRLQPEDLLHDRFEKLREGGEKKKDVPVAVQMEIRPPAPGTSMPILPAKQNNMHIIPGTRNLTMTIIPPTAYPPMHIQPVQEHVKQEMLLTVTP